ncbi:protein THALLO isoform X2 [Raphanus sativus]|uniref:Protein THALLO isoform X2 n=1 Tax=Raphanus sativus TaxID=3726 RepID=A0A9W3DQ57_RAPSA|nr:protein THALLO isoform X2 [Raphanus sativus]
MWKKVGFQKSGSVSTKTPKGNDQNEYDFQLQSSDDEEEEVLRVRAEQIGSITEADAGLEDDSEDEEDRDRELTMEIKGVDGELPPGFEESLATSIANNGTVIITQDTVEPVKINKSRADARRKGEKRKHQNDQVDIQSEEMLLKLRASLQGKLTSNGVFGSTVSKSDKAQKRQKLAYKKLETSDDYDDNDMVDSDGKSEGSEDEFYKQVRQNREAKRAAKAEIYSREPSSTFSLPESVDGKRLISNEDKYTDKVKRRGGQVREIRKPSGPYGGERSGINTNISHSIRIKN